MIFGIRWRWQRLDEASIWTHKADRAVYVMLVEEDEWGIQIAERVGADAVDSAGPPKPLTAPVTRLPLEDVDSGKTKWAKFAGLRYDPASAEGEN